MPSDTVFSESNPLTYLFVGHLDGLMLDLRPHELYSVNVRRQETRSANRRGVVAEMADQPGQMEGSYIHAVHFEAGPTSSTAIARQYQSVGFLTLLQESAKAPRMNTVWKLELVSSLDIRWTIETSILACGLGLPRWRDLIERFLIHLDEIDL